MEQGARLCPVSGETVKDVYDVMLTAYRMVRIEARCQDALEIHERKLLFIKETKKISQLDASMPTIVQITQMQTPNTEETLESCLCLLARN